MTTIEANETSSVVIYAGFWRRVLAYIIDVCVLMPVALVAGFFLAIFVGPIDDAATKVLGIFIAWIYYAICETSKWQGTVGKLALGLKVTNEQLQPVTFGQASVRLFSKLLSGILLIGFIITAFTSKKQALHDIIAKCLVVCK